VLVTRRSAIVGAALVTFALALFAMTPAPVGVFWDDAVYVITAKALATGEGLRYIHLPDAPAATHFPPLWPALLSVVWRIAPDFPGNVTLLKMVNPVLLAVAAAGTTHLAIRATRVRPWVAATTVIASMAVAPLLTLSAVLMSEPLFLALSAAALAAATRLVMRGLMRDAVIAGALVGLAMLSRSIAIALVPALAVGLLWPRSRRAAAVAVGVSVALSAPWFAWSAAHANDLPPVIAGSYGPYATWVADAYREAPGLLGDVVRQNLSRAAAASGTVLFGAVPSVLRGVFAAPLVVMTIVGLALSGRRAAPLSVALLCYASLVIVWPYSPGRFLWPFLPVFAVGVLTAARAIAKRLRAARLPLVAQRIPLGFAAFTLLIVAAHNTRALLRRTHAAPIERNAAGLVGPVSWIARNTAPTDTIASDVHLLAYLYAGRVGIPANSLTVMEYVREKSDAAMRAELAAMDSAFHPTWWIVSSNARERQALVAWSSDSTSPVRYAATIPSGGIAARRAATQ
jgi:hypothetical protein